MTAVENSVSSLEASVNALQVETASAATDAEMTAVENSIDSLEASVNALQAETASAATDAEMTAVENSIDSLEASIGSIDTVQATQNSQLTAAASSVGALEDSVDSLEASVNALQVETASAATDAEMTAVENSIDSLEASVNALQVETASAATDAEMTAVENSVSSLEASINSIETSFVKDPLGIQRFIGSTALESANQSGGTLANTHKAQLSDVVEGGQLGNIIGVYINGLVADPAYYALTSDGGTGDSEVAFQTSYALDANDTIVVKFVKD